MLGELIQGFEHARQAVNQLSYIPSLDSSPCLSKSRKPVFFISQEDLLLRKGTT